MAATQIGAVVGNTTGRLYAIIKPDSDGELDNPAFLSIGNDQAESLRMIKATNAIYNSATTFQQLLNWIATQ